MADLQITKHAVGGNVSGLGVLGGHSGDRVDLVIGAEAHTTDFATYSLVRLYPEAACVIRIGVTALATAAAGETLPAQQEAIRYVKEGERISVIAP